MADSPIKGLPPVHPGELLKGILEELDITTQGFAEHLGLGRQTVYDLMAGRRSVTAPIALRLAKATGGRAEFWMNLQAIHDLKVAEAAIAGELAAMKRIPRIASAAGEVRATSKGAGSGATIAAATGTAVGTSSAKGRGAGVIQGGKGRELIDAGTEKRFAKRDERGTFRETDDVGRSLAADRRHTRDSSTGRIVKSGGRAAKGAA